MKIEDRIIIKTIIIGISITKKIEDQIIIIEMEVFKIIGMEISKIIITNLIIKMDMETIIMQIDLTLKDHQMKKELKKI